MEFKELQKVIQKTFDTVAQNYDQPASQFFPASAAHLTRYLSPHAGEQILDIATGTGNVALAIAASHPKTSVTGIDFSEQMLATAKSKAKQAGISNVSFKHKEMTQLDLPAHYFDAASCGFGIFFLEDMVQGMLAIRHTLKNDGRLVVSSFYKDSFSPLTELFAERIESYDIEFPTQMWQRISTEDSMKELFKDAGFASITTHVEDVSYYVENSEQWWAILWNAGYRGLLNQLTGGQLQQFKQEHLADIDQHMTEKGLHIQVKTIFGVGVKN